MNKHNLLATTLLVSASLSFTACSDAPKGDNAAVTEEQAAATATGQSMMVDTTTSLVKFTGYGVGKNHPGNFKLSSGMVAVTGNQVTGGEFEININSMTMEEQGEMFQTKLKPHLLSGDFFDAAKFGTAKFVITKVEPYVADGKDTSVVAGANATISGNLTLKNETKNVTFPAKVEVTESSVSAMGNFNIDRRQWQMVYGNDKSLGDKFISETVNIQLAIAAKK
jgi:polyisoprenoid-binding protein YceI